MGGRKKRQERKRCEKLDGKERRKEKEGRK